VTIAAQMAEHTNAQHWRDHHGQHHPGAASGDVVT
jgi:hypothetical protein